MKKFSNSISTAILVLASVFAAGCSKDKDKPAPVTPLLSQSSVTVAAGATASVSITAGVAPFSVTVADKTLATATVSGSDITISGVAAGATTFTVKGSDGGGTSAIALTVQPAATPDADAAFKADATLRWGATANAATTNLFYKDKSGSLFDTPTHKTGYTTPDGDMLFIEWEGTGSSGSIRTKTGVTPLHSLRIVQTTAEKIWIEYQTTQTAAKVQAVQRW